ncbi:S66 peptidase family protein [Polyangium sp. 6x1]|uniref:S66 family peptidase n=1 Tax=Polyangium sp. 6x1 TaxID=3042689 RepID=UPI00248310D2|nr:S66 peptidase family protein [Polyangium sp. 6x1]MDI1450000.1 LD-carboxypeptidase [Polyangium sp. 6x1]
MAPIRPRHLRPGDTVAIVSPSWGGPAVFPHVFEQGLAVLREDFGLRVRELRTARMAPAALHADPRARAADLNFAFADPEIAAIIASIGGEDSVRILPYLDREIVRTNPKILLGYSDTTTLLAFGNQLDLVTFHGPSVMAGFAQLRALPPAYAAHLRDMLFSSAPTYTYRPYGAYVERYLDWNDPAHAGLVEPLRDDPDGFRRLQGTSRVEGRLFGGSIETLELMKGTSFWPEPSFWTGRILLFETSEDVPPPALVGYFLRNYGMQGIFDRAAGLVFGRARGYAREQKRELEERIVSIVAGEFGRSDMPIVANVDFGHTDPQLVMPLGVRTELDPAGPSFRLIEPACASA